MKRKFALELLVVLLGMLLGSLLWACSSPTAPELYPADRWIGYWHSDGAQTITKDGVTYLAYMNVETRPDSTCQFVIRQQDMNGGNWAEITSITCNVTVGTAMMQLHYFGRVETANVSWNQAALIQLSGKDPNWDTLLVSAENFELIRQKN